MLPIFRERVWGRTNLQPFFPDNTRKDRIGEVWYTFEENMTSKGKSLSDLLRSEPELLGNAADPAHPGVCPLLVKLLFTTERLSVQVHPDDEYAERHHHSLGKTEGWYVLQAEPHAEAAVGFRETLTPERLRVAAESGEIEHLLEWRSVKSEDFIFTPAGTVHAIGAGLTVCEIQENSDITYRLYDYGRPRELHLDHGVKVSRLGPHELWPQKITLTEGRDELVACEYFRIERLRPSSALRIGAGCPCYMLLVCTRGSGRMGEADFTAGQCWMIPAGNDEIEIQGKNVEWILTYKSAKPTDYLKVI